MEPSGDALAAWEDRTTITIEFPPETERRLRARAAASGRDISTFIREAVEEKLEERKATISEILAPIHQEFRESGMSAAELDSLLEREISAARQERRLKHGGQP